ncbi:protein of unknown function [Pseudodesulfovibrio piezophilus C1TLV30]|uniref:Uncharacterized protein n=1 Tax=Pseudodesulfovibrio piezophilus (strain DSM 21447 / JCM 15486 / C1TLV30) TaxID=1322246 RepID=M1WP77_PSEP2|nr:protein of unknown function [Pseudodesulfovibrio piezophilus C1TLV30]
MLIFRMVEPGFLVCLSDTAFNYPFYFRYYQASAYAEAFFWAELRALVRH